MTERASSEAREAEGSDRARIGPGLEVRGRWSGAGELRVAGRFEGDVALDGVLEVEPGGVVTATVTADRVVVSGHLRGNVQAASELHVRSGGTVDGDVRAPAIAIDDGGTLHGAIVMDFDGPEVGLPTEGR